MWKTLAGERWLADIDGVGKVNELFEQARPRYEFLPLSFEEYQRLSSEAGAGTKRILR